VLEGDLKGQPLQYTKLDDENSFEPDPKVVEQ